jgi:hypothetical protein
MAMIKSMPGLRAERLFKIITNWQGGKKEKIY